MFTINENYLKLQGSYLFSTVAKKGGCLQKHASGQNSHQSRDRRCDAAACTCDYRALQKAVAEMGTKEGFHGYAPERGYDFLLNAIAKEDFAARGCEISPDEIV